MSWTFSFYKNKRLMQYTSDGNAAVNEKLERAISLGNVIRTLQFDHHCQNKNRWHQTVYELDLKGMTQKNPDSPTTRYIQASRLVGEVWEYFDWERDVELAATQALHPGESPGESPGMSPGESPDMSPGMSQDMPMTLAETWPIAACRKLFLTAAPASFSKTHVLAQVMGMPWPMP